MHRGITAINNNINCFKVSCTGSDKRLWTHYVLHLEIAGRVLSVESYDFIPLL